MPNDRILSYESEEPALFWDRMPTPGYYWYDSQMTEWDLTRIIQHASRHTTLTPLLYNLSSDSAAVLALPDGGTAYITMSRYAGDYMMSLWLGAASEEALWEYRSLFSGIPEPVKTEPAGQIYMNYMLRGGLGDARSFSRLIDAPKWAEIQENYSLQAAKQITDLMTAKPGTQSGRICILRGEPGTGKTHILRALAREWRNNARFMYIMDLQNFFTDPGYMTSALLNESNTHGKWQVILCEDAEKYITRRETKTVGTDAHQVGVGSDALSTLLNLGDGMLGQGLRILFVFTTNTAHADLDPAITRPGRCFLDLEVPPLTVDESTKWLRSHGRDMQAVRPMTLTDLYHIQGHVPESSPAVPSDDPLADWEHDLLGGDNG